MSHHAECDVLIAGGGPVGVTLGLLLAREGVRTTVVEREAGVYPLPRTARIDRETVRILQSLGLADAVLAAIRTVSR